MTLYLKSKTRNLQKFSFTSKFYTDFNSRFKSPKNKLRQKLKRFQYDLEGKWKFSRFPSFRFYPILKIENSEITEIYLLLQILTVVVTQDLKTTKNWTETKTESSRYVIKRKNEHFWVFRVFDFCSITKIEILEILEMLFTSNFDTGCNSRFKNDKKWTETKTKRFRYDLEEKWKFRRFPNFRFETGGLRRM